MSEKQWRKLDALEHVVEGDWTMEMGAQAAGLSLRHFRRLRRAYETAEEKSCVVVHGNQGRGPSMCLMGAIDDATGKILRGAHFVPQECSAGYLRLLYDMARHHGVPLEIYADRHSCLRRNDDHWTLDEQLAGRQDPPRSNVLLKVWG